MGLLGLVQRVELFDARAHALLGRLVGALHTDQVSDCLYYPRSQYYVTSCEGGLIKLWARHHSANALTAATTTDATTTAETADECTAASGAVAASRDDDVQVSNHVSYKDRRP